MQEFDVDRLYNKLDAITDVIHDVQKEVYVIGGKVSDFDRRIQKLEERENDMEKLMVSINDYMESSKSKTADNEERIDVCELNIVSLKESINIMKNNQKWVAGICSFIGGVVGFLINLAVHFFVKGG